MCKKDAYLSYLKQIESFIIHLTHMQQLQLSFKVFWWSKEVYNMNFVLVTKLISQKCYCVFHQKADGFGDGK